MQQIDINCDMGESYGRYQVGNDAAIFPFITSCNIACGFHGGDPLTIEKTIRGALSHGVQIGAHPGFPDLSGFGRRQMHIPEDELEALVKYQVAALKGMTEGLGGKLTYVKPHGALYNMAADNPEITMAIMAGVHAIDPNLVLMGMAGSVMQKIAISHGVPFIAEAFADRMYTNDGRLMSRALPGSVIDDAELAARQVISIIKDQCVTSHEGAKIVLTASSICIHGDNPGALQILQAIDVALVENNISKQSFALA